MTHPFGPSYFFVFSTYPFIGYAFVKPGDDPSKDLYRDPADGEWKAFDPKFVQPFPQPAAAPNGGARRVALPPGLSPCLVYSYELDSAGAPVQVFDGNLVGGMFLGTGNSFVVNGGSVNVSTA